MARRQLQDGELLGSRYRVVELRGMGGMGEVYEVEHVALGRRFAAKVLRRELANDPVLLSRFGSEVRAMARLRSDHVAHIIDVGELDNGSPFFVMELLNGIDLKTLLNRVGSLAPSRAVRLLIHACWGLRAVHSAGLVHRDVKPSNLFIVTTDSGDERCVLLDFGVTKSSTTAHTRAGQLIGTLQYMAPEQLEGGTVDARADVYSLGAVLYECLVGHPPHLGDTLERVVYSIMNKDPIPLSRHCPSASKELSKVVECSLSRSGAARYASIGDLVHALGACEEARNDVTFPAWANEATQTVFARKASNFRNHKYRWLALVAVGLVVGWTLGGPLIWRHSPMAEVKQTSPPNRGTVPALSTLESANGHDVMASQVVSIGSTAVSPEVPATRADTPKADATKDHKKSGNKAAPRTGRRSGTIDDANPYE